jgi:hypothetical protein
MNALEGDGMNCECCGGPGPVGEFGLADGDIALCKVCWEKTPGAGPFVAC